MSHNTPQALAVYSAEDRLETWLARAAETDGMIHVFGSAWIPEPEIRFAEVADVRTYCAKVLDHIGHPEPVKVITRRGYKAAAYHRNTATITIPVMRAGVDSWALRQHTVLHELAHHLTPLDMDHGKDFRDAFVRLLREVGQPVNATLLSIAFSDVGLT